MTGSWGAREEVEHLNLQVPKHNEIKASPNAILGTASCFKSKHEPSDISANLGLICDDLKNTRKIKTPQAGVPAVLPRGQLSLRAWDRSESEGCKMRMCG